MGAPAEDDAGDRPTTMDSLVRAVARVDALPTLAPGQVLDDTYELTERIGGGGMGVVFRARDRRLGRDVAVKVLKAASRSEQMRRLFEREARATAQLLHPNIVTLHHVGEHDGHPYLVLELLQGETLATRLARRHRMPIGEGLELLDPVLAALAFAHERGVLHRDLKPNNVFITVDDRVKVLDFGVALSLDVDPGPVTRAAGTPGYMAPEQRDGRDQDARTDVWAAALLLVECVLGRRPDEAGAARAVDELEAPAAVRRVLARALAADPAERPSSAASLRGALARAAGRHAPTPPLRRRLAVAVAIAAAAAIGAAVTYAVVYAPPPADPPTGAEISRAWLVNFGNMLVDIDERGNAYAVYGHDEGIIVGHYHDGLLIGRWCELPSRTSSDDSGVIELRFARSTRDLVVEGRWKYGDALTAPWQIGPAGFFGRSDAAPPPELARRFAQRMPCP
ncbi:MAG: serine/threonine-protein kinase [Kofleriaceae bacterium]